MSPKNRKHEYLKSLVRPVIPLLSSMLRYSYLDEQDLIQEGLLFLLSHPKKPKEAAKHLKKHLVKLLESSSVLIPVRKPRSSTTLSEPILRALADREPDLGKRFIFKLINGLVDGRLHDVCEIATRFGITEESVESIQDSVWNRL